MTTVVAWVRDLFVVILSVTFLEILVPEGHMAGYLKFIFAVIVLAVMLSPLRGLYT